MFINLLRELHAQWLWPLVAVVLVLLFIGLLVSRSRQLPWSRFHSMLCLALLILLDLQVLFGLLLWTAQQRWTGASALISWEHPFTMILALVIYHIGYRRIKTASESSAKLNSALIWSTVCLALVGLGLIRAVYFN